MRRRPLFALAYSPCSEKARCALDHHRLPYEQIAFVPLLGTLGLKLVSGRLFGRTSVPTLLDDDGKAYIDSLGIARHADGIGQGTILFPDGADEATAGSVGLSTSRLAHLFREQSGQTPQQYLEGLRMQRATELLRRTGFSIKQIADAVGFESQFYFSQRFKARTHQSPSSFRAAVLPGGGETVR